MKQALLSDFRCLSFYDLGIRPGTARQLTEQAKEV